jgi:hypothetical protein
MNDIVTLALPTTTLCRLLQYTAIAQQGASASDIAALAIDEWLGRAEGQAKPGIRCRGYQWKSLFLPEGTQLRAWNGGEYAYAEVAGDALLYAGEVVSPHQFICRCKGISRNAWAELAILFPNAEAWRTAAACRQDLSCRPQLQTHTAPPTAAPAPAPWPPETSSSPGHARPKLPRVPPIPTQLRHQQPAGARPPIEEIFPAAKDRRRAYRRAEDLLLE